MVKKVLIFLAILIALLIILWLLLINLPPTINTIYAPRFDPETWQNNVGAGMTRTEVRKLLGEPLSIHNPTRCDFYSHYRTVKWLNYLEYKVCYDGNEIFFLKLRTEQNLEPDFL